MNRADDHHVKARGATNAAGDVRISPFLHIDSELIRNPVTNRKLRPEDKDFALLVGLLRDENREAVSLDPGVRRHLVSDGWLTEGEVDASSSHYLRVVSLETNTVCNQKCYFCPVSIDPREDAVMPDSMFDSILEQLTGYRESLEGIFLQSYNEPTVDRRFVDHIRQIMKVGLPAAVLTNGTGMTPKRIDAILENGPMRFLSVNFSTMDPERYREDRGKDQVDLVLQNLDYMKDRQVADEMRILVLGRGDEIHRSDMEAISARFSGSRFIVESHEVMDRAGYLEFGLRPGAPIRNLRGCDNLGSRPIEHLHITPRGLCVLCCEDYDENHVVDDLTQSTISEVLSGPGLSQMRRWVYGLDDAPDDFICRRCVFARSGD